MEKKTMGSFMAALRRAKGMTQQEVADLLLVSNRAVSRWERDDSAPDLTLLPAIADLYGVTVDELLRGERRRTPDETLTVPDHGCSEAESPPLAPDPRALRGLRAIVRQALSRFRTFVSVSLALSAAGFICMLGISYGFYRPIIGFAVLLLFSVGATVCAVMGTLRLREVLIEQAAEEGEVRLPVQDRIRAAHMLSDGSFAAFVGVGTTILLSVLLIIPEDSYYSLSVLSIGSYLPMCLLLGLVLAMIIATLRAPYHARMLSSVGLSDPSTTPVISRCLLILNAWQGAAALLFGASFFIRGLFPDYSDYASSEPYVGAWFQAIAQIITLLGLIVAPLVMTRVARKMSDPVREKRDILISGVRNILCFFTALFIMGGSIGYGRTMGEVYWRMYVDITAADLMLTILSAVVIFLAASLIRRRIRHKKA